MSSEQAIIRGAQARDLLDNPLLKEAFAAIERHLDQQALSCDPDNKDQAQRIIIARQIAAGIKRELVRVIEDGSIAQVRLNEITKKRGLFKR